MLLGQAEADTRPKHPLISHVPVPPIEVETITGIDVSDDPRAIREMLRAICTSPAPNYDNSSEMRAGSLDSFASRAH